MMGPTVKASRMTIERGSDGYPPGVLDLANAPKRLYMLGNPEALQGPAIAIVGTRSHMASHSLSSPPSLRWKPASRLYPGAP